MVAVRHLASNSGHYMFKHTFFRFFSFQQLRIEYGDSMKRGKIDQFNVQWVLKYFWFLSSDELGKK